MFGEYHASCMLKMSFVDFEKEKADCTRYIAVNVFVLDIFSCSDISLFVGFCFLFVFIVNCIPTRATDFLIKKMIIKLMFRVGICIHRHTERERERERERESESLSLL
jgi:hypothetical protein